MKQLGIDPDGRYDGGNAGSQLHLCRELAAEELAQSTKEIKQQEPPPEPAKDEPGFWDDAEVVSVNTRQQAIDDGVLIDVTELAKLAGVKFHTAVTAEVFAETMECPPELEARGLTLNNRVLHVLQTLVAAVRALPKDTRSDRVDFTVSVDRGDKREDVALYSLCGPGDNTEPVVTIMLPWQD